MRFCGLTAVQLFQKIVKKDKVGVISDDMPQSSVLWIGVYGTAVA